MSTPETATRSELSYNEERHTINPRCKLLEVSSRYPPIEEHGVIGYDFWNKLFDRLTAGRKTVSLGVRDIERFILGSAFEVEPDKQGRIIIPEILAEYAKLKKDLVFVGLGDRVEIWPKEVWDEKGKSLLESTKEYIERLSENEIKQ